MLTWVFIGAVSGLVPTSTPGQKQREGWLGRQPLVHCSRISSPPQMKLGEIWRNTKMKKGKIFYMEDQYKEDSRQYRRTVFESQEDWIQYRSSGRIFKNLRTTFTSGVVRGLWVELATLTMVAAVVCTVNALVSLWKFSRLTPIDGRHFLALPALPFTLSSPALGGVSKIIFQVPHIYGRWNQARLSWEQMQVHCNNLARQGMAYLDPHEKEEYARRIIAFAHTLKGHFRRDDEGEEGKLGQTLKDLLGVSEARRLMASRARPVQALSDLSRIIRRSKVIDGSTKSRFDAHLDALNQAFVTCEGLQKMPVPLVYTRHTERFLGLWRHSRVPSRGKHPGPPRGLLLLPLAMVNVVRNSPLLIPISSLMGMFYLGIEELGIQIEEPFSIMPLEDIVLRIETNTEQMLRYEVDMPGDASIGADVKALQ